jgi:predicted ester cyclase
MPTPTLQQVLRQVLSAFDQQDWTIFDSHPGLYETRQHLPHLYASFPDLHHTIEVELGEGEMIACVAQVRGTHREPYMGIAPTGKQVSFMLMLIERIVEGYIVEHWALPDFLSLGGQLGATIASPEPHALPSSDV